MRNSAEQHILDSLEPDSPLYLIAISSLNLSHSWALGVIKMGDDVYRMYVRAKFGSAVAFHVSTRLMRVLFLKVAKPRHQVSLALKAANQEQIAKVVLLATLRSLDVMREIQQLGFINHSSVSNELVKFLAVNTEFQSVTDLKTTTTVHTADIKELRKEMAGNVKAVGTMGNRFDTVSRELVALTKRVKALE